MSKTTSKKQGRKTTTAKAKTSKAAARSKTATKKVAAKTSKAKTSAKAVKAAPRKLQAKTAPAATLNAWNKALVVLYLIQGLALLVFANAKNIAVTTTYLTPDPLASSGGELVRVNATRALFDVNLVYLLVATLVVMISARLAAATFYRVRYEAELNERISKIRWLELGLGGGLMVVTVAMICGVSDLASLVMLFVLTEVAAFSALLLEEKITSVANYATGLKGLLLPWLVVGGYLVGSSVYGHANTPAFVYWIFGTMAAAFGALAVTAYLTAKQKSRWIDYMYSEKTYVILSFVAITALIGQVFFGLLRP